MRSIVAIALLSACAEPVVEMQLVLPTNGESFDTSCVKSVAVFVNGANYLQDDDDDTYACLDIQDASSYQAIHDQIRGQFDVAVPASGLLGVEVYGWSTACDADDEDVLFLGHGSYIGQERIDIPLVPNLDCTRNEVKVRMFDMFALVGGASCDVAGTYTGEPSAGLGTIFKWPFEKGTGYEGGVTSATVTGNLATISGLTQAGPQSCVAIAAGTSESGGSYSCVVGGPSVCAAPGEVEHATIPYSVLDNLDNYDATLKGRFPNVIFGSVWSGGATKTPLAGATIEIDPAHGKVVYIDPPTATGLVRPRSSTSTGPSGLFMIYADAVLNAKVTANGMSRTVKIAGSDEGPAAAMIVVGP